MFFERHKGGEEAILVYLEKKKSKSQESIQEFEELSSSAGVKNLSTFKVLRHHPSPKYFLSNDKAEELRDLIRLNKADIVIFNHTLSATQEKNLEKIFECRVIDRTRLILDIFAKRARTYEGKLQVELAQLGYMSSRLIRGWLHLERQAGGIGLRGGAGETQLEIDKRLLRIRIEQIKDRLEKVRNQRKESRKSRRRSNVLTVSLVGYTNSGKSSLFNTITGSRVLTANQLFATLDPTIRRIEIDGLGTVVLVDTVGFIRDLPHKLIEAFRSTLEELCESDLLLHVIDISETDYLERIKQVDGVLHTLGTESIPLLKVYNKIDLLKDKRSGVKCDSNETPHLVSISVKEKSGLSLLKKSIAKILNKELFIGCLKIGVSETRLRAKLFSLGAVEKEEYNSGFYLLSVTLSRDIFNKLLMWEKKESSSLLEENHQ